MATIRAVEINDPAKIRSRRLAKTQKVVAAWNEQSGEVTLIAIPGAPPSVEFMAFAHIRVNVPAGNPPQPGIESGDPSGEIWYIDHETAQWKRAEERDPDTGQNVPIKAQLWNLDTSDFIGAVSGGSGVMAPGLYKRVGEGDEAQRFFIIARPDSRAWENYNLNLAQALFHMAGKRGVEYGGASCQSVPAGSGTQAIDV